MNLSLRLLLALPLSLALAGCPPVVGNDDDSGDDDDDSTEEVDFAMWGPDHITPVPYAHNYDCEQTLPPANSCYNPNPEIAWEGAPEGTESFVLIFDDPTAGDFPHWAILNIPGDATGLAADSSGDGASGSIPSGSTELDNGFGYEGYLGSCPGGTNEYRWRLWALDTELDASLYTALGNAGAAYDALASDAEDNAIEMVSMCHVFRGSDAPVGR
ncbi:MAG: YbhB/YbcL family Raf kinase inhibitor-like protein [Deltaproteobacteria bacterium]|nr:YbhB/YbcL family Raf kinase inhibitor-like protein [Deltaproteobacteria bacterium]